MRIPHDATGSKDSGYIDIKPKNHIKKVSQDIFEKGDPNFVDERYLEDEKDKAKEERSFFALSFSD